jgi:pSer/pThr/pTyr-binding forkhead associated (FHA) protein/uncharacterized RDD family membrane protein YckC
MEKIIILENKRFKIDKKKLTVGRAKDCDIQLNDEKVSRTHGIIHNIKDELYYEDLGSSNGSYINNKLVTGKKRIKEGDIIQIGTFVLKVDLEIPTRQYPALEKITSTNGIQCPGCGKTVSREAKFCVFCGSPVKELVRNNTVPCPNCKKSIIVGSEYCNHCGVELGEETFEIDLSEVTPVFMTTHEHKKISGKIVDPEKITKHSKKASEIETQQLPEKDFIKGTEETELLDMTPNKREQKLIHIIPAKPAGFFARFFASIIDLIVVDLLLIIFVFAPVYLIFAPGINLQFNSNTPKILYEQYKSFGIKGYIALSAGAVLITLIYLIGGWARKGSTPGKRLLGIYIFNGTTNRTPLRYGKAFLRYIGYILSGVTIIGFLLILITKKKKGFHDFIAGTEVHYRKK